jgi:uncharacterized membrane protein YjfL (UPF0719 family)
MSAAKLQLLAYLGTLGWAIVGAISMGIALGVALKIFTVLTPGIEEMEELKKGNMAVAIVICAVILAMGLVVAVTVIPESIMPVASN